MKSSDIEGWAASTTTAVPINTSQYRLIKDPKYIGCWSIANELHIYMTKKPSWFHRVMMKLLLGIKWVDIDDSI